MRRCCFAFLAVAGLLSFHPVRAQSNAACLTTLAPGERFVPPAPYLQDAGEGRFWYGTRALWTGLSYEGNWGGLHNDKGYRQKLFFWSKGYDWRKEPKPDLIITARRLDGNAPDVAVADANNAFVPSRDAAAIVTAFELPTEGCWDVTAHFRGRALTFTVSVKP